MESSFARYNPKYTTSYNNPDRRAPSETVNKIFLKASSGRYFDIMSAITQERSLLNLVDIQNRSILHLILMNQDLSKTDKYNLIKASIDLGAPVDTPDVNGVRPLHLASGQQNRKVVKLLLQKKAEVNSKTSNQLTPLHYAVIPDTVDCGKGPVGSPNKLIPDTEKIQQQFRTDDLFNEVYETFKNDPITLMYISHISSIFRNRFVYQDSDADAKEVAKIVKDVISERSGRSSIESMREKLVDLRNTISTKTRGELGKTYSELEIKENTSDGWGPTVGGARDKKNNVLPFANLRYAFNGLYDTFSKSNNSVVKNVVSQMKKTLKYATEIKTYIMDVDKLVYELGDISSFIDRPAWGPDVDNVFGNDGRVNLLRNAVLSAMNINGIVTPLVSIPIPDMENNTNFTEIVPPVGPDFGVERGRLNLFSSNQTQHPTRPGQNLLGLGVILDTYRNSVVQKLNNIELILTNVTNELIRGARMSEQADVFKHLSNAQFMLINVCYILMHFETYAKSLSSCIEKLKVTLSEQDLFPVIEYVSTLINEGIDTYTNVQHTPFGYGALNAGGYNQTVNKVVYYQKDNIHMYIYQDAAIANNYTFLKLATPQIDPATGNYFVGHYVVRHGGGAGINLIGKVSSGARSIMVNSMVGSELSDKLDKIVEMGGYGREGQYGQQNIVNNMYSAVQKLQTTINSLISNYNMTNGYIFMDVFHNHMRDDTYNTRRTDNFMHIMMSQMKSFKILPETYKQFYDIYVPIMKSGGVQNPANNLALAKALVNTYCPKLTNTNGMYIIRQQNPPAQPQLPVGLTAQTDGVVSVSITPASSIVTQAPNPIILGRHAEFVGNVQLNKTDSLPQTHSIVGFVYDSHLYIIKLVLLMYMCQKFADVYHNGTTGGALTPAENKLFEAMRNIYDQINEMSTINPLGTLLAVMAKMIDGIFLSSVNNISLLSASNYIKFLATAQNIRNIPFDSLLADAPPATFNLEKSQLITKPDERVRLRDDDIVASVVSKGLHGPLFQKVPGSIDVDVLKMFKVTNTATDTDTLSRMVNFDSADSLNDVCYKIDEDVIAELLSAGALPNVVGREGETPLSLAVTIQNENVIDALLRAGSKINISTGSRNVYDECFSKLLNCIESSPIMEIDEIDLRVKDHLEKKTGVKNTFSNSNLIMRMTSYLFVHQLSLIINTYPNMWSRENQKNLLSMLGLTNVDRDIIPLAKIDTDLIAESIQGYATINDTIEAYRLKLNSEREVYNRLDNSINNLNAELRDLKPTDTFRTSEINELIAELTAERADAQRRIGVLTNTIRDLIADKQAIDNTASVVATTGAIQGSSTMHRFIRAVRNRRSRDVCNVYDVFFKDVINLGAGGVGPKDVYNSEYTTYLNTWAKLVARPDEEYLTDHTQVAGVLTRRLLQSGRVSPQIFLDSYPVVCELYDKVLSKYGRDLTELMPYLAKDGESYYESNYVLKQIYCIMYHVFKHTMSINFVSTIAQLLARRDKGRTEAAIMRNVYQAMKSSEFIKYCMETLPKLVIKVVCKISESDKDPDLNLTVTDILNKGVDRLSLSTFEGVDKSTVEQAKEVVVPFFVSYMEAYTAEMHMFMVKQCKLMMVQGRLLNILKMLATKAVRENSS